MFKSPNKGFTIIEATVAISILLIGLLAVTQFFPFSLKIINNSQNFTTASNLAVAKIEELRSLNYDNIGTGTIETKTRLSADPSNYLYAYQRQTVVQYLDSNFNTSETDQGIKKINVTVYWYSPIGAVEKFISINSLVVRF
jgi:prepilin-type N-terminal cleavage/methylation domain-containing protein